MLSITFMGQTQFLLDGVDVSGQISSKSAAILALILLNSSQQMRRSDLIGFLWGESEDDAAKYNLRFNLWQIKKTLVQADGEPFLLVSKDVVRINPHFSFRCDIVEIEQADPETMDSIGELKHLLSLFRGDFLENCSLHNCDGFLEHIILRRYYLENRKLVVYRRLIHLTYENKLYDDCLHLLSACEEIDPYNEDIAQIRLEILLQRNARREAAQYYQMFYSRLLRDVGVEPSVKLQELSKHLHLQESKEPRGRVLHLEVCTVPSLPGGWMSQVLRALYGCALRPCPCSAWRLPDGAAAFRPGVFPARAGRLPLRPGAPGADSRGVHGSHLRPLRGRLHPKTGNSVCERRPPG